MPMRSARCACSRPSASSASRTDALLPGLHLRDVRQGAGDAAARDHALLPALALRRRQALCLLDHGELPRGLRHLRLQRHPVQPRVADPRRDLRHAQDHARPGPHPRRPATTACTSATWTRAATGATPATTCGAVADAAAARAGGLRHRHRRAVLGARVRRARRIGARHADRLARQGARGGRRRARHRQDDRAHRPALLPPHRGRVAARRCEQGARQARLAARGQLRGAGEGDGRGRPRPGEAPPAGREPGVQDVQAARIGSAPGLLQ